MANNLTTVGDAAACSNLCATGRQLKNVGRVRLQVMVNDYCPFYGIRQQDETFQFDSQTFSVLPPSVQAKVKLPGAGLDGIILRETFILRSNLLFVKSAPPAQTNGDAQQNETTSDQVVENWNSTLQKIYDVNQKQATDEYVPHYAWTHTGSLFDNKVIQPDTYTVSDATTGPTVNLAKWGYKVVNCPVSVQTTADNQKLAPTDPEVLFPLQSVSGTITDTRGMHWSCEKRRPVFQGADFFLIVHRIASESTIQSSTHALQARYKALDSRLTNNTGNNGVLINGGIVETDQAGVVIEESKDILDLNNQVYLIVEIGQDDPDHNYFIILAEKTFPTFVHVGTAAVAVKQPDGSIEVVVPTQPISRRISTLEGVSSAELLNQRKLLIKVRNHMGRLVVTFSGHEDTPWIIERRDLIDSSVASQSGQSAQNNGSDNTNYVESSVPCIVPPAKLAIHGGNIKLAYNWGYLKYTPQSVFRMPQTVHIEGTQNAIPELKDVNLKLAGFQLAERVPNTENDVIYNHDALLFSDFIGGSKTDTTALKAQPYSYAQYGKGAIPSRHKTGGNSTTSFTWPSQSKATPNSDMSNIVLTAANMRPVNGDSRAQQFDMYVTLTAGHFSFGPDPEVVSSKGCQFINVMTPICTGYKMSVQPRGCSFRPAGVDVSPWVSQFSETWTAQDYAKIEHSGTLKFFITDGMRAVYANPNANYGDGQGRDQQPWPPVVTVPDQTAYISSLVDKTFYVRIKAWYEQSGVFPNSQNNQNAYIFTGMCHGGKLTYENGRRTMECHVQDFSKVLQDQFFLNSPYYDAVRDYIAVRDILKQASLNSGTQGSSCSGGVYPASFVDRGAKMSQTAGSGVFDITYMDGNSRGVAQRSVSCRGFALPGSYDRLQNPVFRFKDGDRFLDAITRMANVASKQIYFDRFGVFHYEDRIDTLLTSGILNENDIANDPTMVKERFYASPKLVTSGEACDSYGQIAYNSYTWERLAGDVVNQIMVVSASPDGALLIGGDKNYDLIDNPSKPGFLGYPKQFLQMNGIFGSEEAVRTVVENYTTMYKPPLNVSFETFGRSYLKALDIITFTGLDADNNYGGKPQPLRVTNISTEIIPEKNTWWSKIDAQWLYSGDGVDWQISR